MAQFVNMFDVDLQAGKPNIFPLKSAAGEGDANGFQVGARVTDGGEYIALGGSCVGKVIRADGETVPLTGTISGNTAYVVLDQQSCAVEGPIQIAVCWTQDSNVTTLLVAYGTVVNTQTGSIIQPSEPIPDLTQLIAKIGAMEAATAEARAAAASALGNFAGAFSDAVAYVPGQYVTYTDGYFYRFVADHMAGAWSASDVKRITSGQEFEALRRANGGYDAMLGVVRETPSTTVNGWRINAAGNAVQNADYALVKYAVTAGSRIFIRAKRDYRNSGASFQFQTNSSVPSNNNSYIVGAPYLDEYNYFIMVPSTATYLIFSVLKSDVQECGIFTTDAYELMDHVLKYIPVSQASANSDYGKLAENLPGNTFCWVDSSWFTDLPSGTYWVFTLAESRDYDTFAAQYAYAPATGITYTRRRSYVGSAWTWSDWATVYLYKGVLASNTDLNGVTSLGIHGLSTAGNYDHKPGGFSSGYLMVVDYGGGYATQFAFDYYDGTTYTRAYTGTAWTAWVCYGVHDTGAKYFAFGDSIVYGQIGGVTPTTQSKNNYPALAGKLLHMQTVNMAVPGQGLVKDWDDIHNDYIADLDMDDAKLITIGWDYNDSPYYSSMNFGVYTDTDETVSLVGKYFTIMREFQMKCPSAKLILITGYGTPDGQVGPPVVKPTLETQWTYQYAFADGNKTKRQIYDTLEQMCHEHGWSCINQAHGTTLNQYNADDLIGDQIHLTDAGYLVYGNFIAAQIASMYGNLAGLN